MAADSPLGGFPLTDQSDIPFPNDVELPFNRQQQIEINTSRRQFKEEMVLALLRNSEFVKGFSPVIIASRAKQVVREILEDL